MLETNNDISSPQQSYEKPIITEIGNATELVLGGGEYQLDADNQTHLD